MAHGTAHDTAQHITPTFVGWHYAVTYKESNSPDVVGDNLERGSAPMASFFPSQLAHHSHNGHKQIGFIVVINPLQHCRHAFKPHACIHRWVGYRY